VHIRADRDALAEAFGRANRGAGVRTALPILQGVLCQTAGGRLNITGSDTEVTIRTWANVEVIEEGSFVVPGRLITEAIRRMPEGAVTIRALEGEVELSGNGPAFTIRPLSLEDYPNLPEADLTGAYLNDAHLNRADLSGADLSDCKGLTQECIDQAEADSDNPPNLESSVDANTGKPLVWRGKPVI